MVVDKRDLAIGRAPGPADGELGALAIGQYRKDKTKALPAEDISPIQSQGDGSAGPRWRLSKYLI